jgi:hypothetical protein
LSGTYVSALESNNRMRLEVQCGEVCTFLIKPHKKLPTESFYRTFEGSFTSVAGLLTKLNDAVASNQALNTGHIDSKATQRWKAIGPQTFDFCFDATPKTVTPAYVESRLKNQLWYVCGNQNAVFNKLFFFGSSRLSLDGKNYPEAVSEVGAGTIYERLQNE